MILAAGFDDLFDFLDPPPDTGLDERATQATAAPERIVAPTGEAAEPGSAATTAARS